MELADCSGSGVGLRSAVSSAMLAAAAEDTNAPLPPLPPELSHLLPKGGLPQLNLSCALCSMPLSMLVAIYAWLHICRRTDCDSLCIWGCVLRTSCHLECPIARSKRLSILLQAATAPPCWPTGLSGYIHGGIWTWSVVHPCCADPAAAEAAVEQPYAAALEAKVDRLQGELQHSQASYRTVLRALHRKVGHLPLSQSSPVVSHPLRCDMPDEPASSVPALQPLLSYSLQNL